MADLPRIHLPAPREIPAPPGDALGPALNAAQAEAASHGDTPLLIVAGAGSGKTRTLIHRVAHLINRGVPAHRILLLTFTRRAAQEMLDRCQRLVGSASQQVQGGTFHGIAHRLLRRFGPAAGLPADFTILDQGDAADLMGTRPRRPRLRRFAQAPQVGARASRAPKRCSPSTRATSTPTAPSPT